MLLKQEKAEAETAVRGRLDFIGKETERVEKTVAEMQERSEGKKMEVGLTNAFLTRFSWFSLRRVGGGL